MGSFTHQGNDVSQNLNVLLVGPRRTGKSSSGNTLLGLDNVFDTKGCGVSTAASGHAAGLQLYVVDSQGWDSSAEVVPRQEKVELLRAVSLFQPGGPDAILLVIPLLDFTETARKAVENRMELLTPAVWRHTMVLFTCGDKLRRRGCSVEEHIKSGGPALQWLMEKCRYRYHVFDNKASRTELREGREREATKHEGTWQQKLSMMVKKKSTRSEADEGKEGGPKQVRELLSKVSNLLEENGGWHFSLHMYLRLEEEWIRREQVLRVQLQAEMDARKERENEEKWAQRKMDGGKNTEDRLQIKLKRVSSEEDMVRRRLGGEH